MYKQYIDEINNLRNLETIINYYYPNQLKKNKMNCPFHKERTPSFSITDKGNGAFYHCFGCGEGGGRKGSLPPARGTPVSPKWESGETEFDRLGGELSVCLSVCLPGGSWGWHRQRGRGCLTCQN